MNTADYYYLANSDLMTQIVFKASGYVMNTTTKNFDLLNRLSSLNFVPSGTGVAAASGYVYNDANQRTRKTEADGSYWVHRYDALGQVTSGKRFWNDGTAVAGQQFEYAFDDIGNRTATKAGGDATGGSLRTASYTNNFVNQIASRDVPGAVDVIGAATVGAAVTVNGLAAYRYGEYFQKALPTNNTSAEVYLAVTNIANLGGTNQTNVGYLFIPKTAEVFAYDADGNLTNDGRWSLAWDAENRLTNMTSKSSAPTASKYKLDFKYDTLGRRVQKVVSTNNGGSYFGLYTNKFVYDAWNLAAILDGQNSILYSFQWGTDASGSWEGAGGVGGLISMRVHTGTLAGTYFYCYDGNYNVVALISAASGAVMARYEYGPFGEVIRATGTLAFLNPFQFSTKFQDEETGFQYYGYRYYNPSIGRWLTSDPRQEEGGLNLYSAFGNDPTSSIDNNGLETLCTVGIEVVTVPRLHHELPRRPGFEINNAEELIRWSAVESAAKEGFFVLSVDSVQNANTQLQKFKCCIQTLHVEGHGAGTGQWVGTVHDANDARALYVRYKPRGKLNEVEFHNVEEMFKSVNFCKSCTIWLRGCGVAFDAELYGQLKSKVKQLTGCELQAYASDCYLGRRGLMEPGRFHRDVK